jgi:hypothetical protein
MSLNLAYLVLSAEFDGKGDASQEMECRRVLNLAWYSAGAEFGIPLRKRIITVALRQTE